MDDRIDPTMFAGDEDRFAIGQPVPRSEDPVLLRGEGHYCDDFNLPGQAYCGDRAQPLAHGVIRSIDTAAARGDARGARGLYRGRSGGAVSGRCRRGRS